MQATTRLLHRLRRDRRGVSNIIVIVLSFIIIVIIVSNVVLWSYQMNQLDWEKMREDMAITNVEHATRSSWFVAQSEYTVNIGSRVSGTYTDTQSIDTSFESFNETAQAQSYYPSGFNLLNSTKHSGGVLSDLQSDDSVYMTFSSYVSSSSTTAKTNAFIAYRDSTTTLNTPKERTWTGDTASWGSQNEMTTANSPVRFVRVAYSPIEQRSMEKIVVTLSDDGYLDAYVFDGASWNVTNNIASVGVIVNAYRCFDIAYEKTSGRALLVYSRGTTTNEIGYKIWTFRTGWSTEYLLNLAYTTGRVNWVCLASAPGTRSGTADDDEIAMIYLDSNTDVHGYVWTGSSWSLMGVATVWDATAAIATEECITVAYEQQSGRAMFIWGDGTTDINNYRIWDGNTLSALTTLTITAQGAVTNWVALKSNPISNELMYLVVDGASDLNTAYWSGSAWTIHTEHDGTVDTNAQRCADFAWEPTGSKGLLCWGTTAGFITYRTFTAPNTWGTITNVVMRSGAVARSHPWVQLRTNPRSISGDIMILGAVAEATDLDLGAISWNGTAFTVIGASTFSTDINVITRECFEIEFMNFGPPTEFAVEVEFTGASNAGAWTQLVWTIDSAWTSSSVSVTLQLYNYTLGSYPTSGNGYMNYTSSATANTDEIKNQTITENPTHFRNATGYWKIKVKGVKTGAASFDFKADLVVFSPGAVSNCQLDLNGTFIIDLSTYPLAYIQTMEILVRYRASDAGENWYLKAYNWTALAYSDSGFNTTAGHMPTTGWDDYVVNLTSSWRSYVANNGTMYVKFVDGTPDSNSTTIDIDFLGIRATFDGANFTFKNQGSLTSHLVSLWIINSTSHRRYNADVFVNSAEIFSYIRADIPLPSGQYTVKVVTERGNMAVYFGS